MSARDVVTSHIAEQARRFPDWINQPLALASLNARDASLAAAIEHAVMRRWLSLVAVIESRLSRPWAEIEFKMQASLLVGAAQLLLLDRLPDHAVINEAVEWSKRHVRPKAGGMVNAVLRKVATFRAEMASRPSDSQDVVFDRDQLPLGDGRAWRLTEPVFAEAAIERLAQQTSHPVALLARWSSLFGEAATRRLALHNLVQPPIIIHVPRLTDEASDSPEPQNDFRSHNEFGYFVFEGNRGSLVGWLADHPDTIVQDPTSAAAVEATRGIQPAPRLIIDACAGMGTKTRQLAALHPQATIIATDIADVRLLALRSQFAHNARVKVIEHDRLSDWISQADLVLLDVPCSNTGVLARRVEARYRFSRETLESVVDLQRQIIADSLTLVRGPGHILYSTCSIDPDENERQAEWLCRWHPFEIVHQRTRVPTGMPGDSPGGYSDGGYHALLRRLPSNSLPTDPSIR